MHRAGSVTALVTAALLCAVGVVRADTGEPDFESARAHYRAAQQAARDGRWDEAAAEYAAAFEITGDPVLHFRIADARQNAGRCEAALEHYDRYLKDAEPAEAYAELALRRVRACQDEILAEREAEDAGRTEAEPETDSEAEPATGVGAEPETDSEAEPATGVGAEQRAAAGSSTGGAGRGDLAQAPAELPRRTWHRGVAWTGTGLAIVAAATSGILAASAADREDDLDRLIAARDPDTGAPFGFEGNVRDRYRSLVREGENLALGSQIALGVAGAAAATAAVLFLVDPTRGAGPALAPAASGSGVGLAAGWTF